MPSQPSAALALQRRTGGTMGPIHPTGRWLLAFLCASFASITSAAQSPTPIRHVVIVVMENHSFDSIFGTFPGANGATSGLIGPTLVPLTHLNDQPPADFDHTRDGARIDIDGGKMDASNRHNCADPPYWCYGQYWQADIPNLWAYAKTFA